MIEIFFFLGFLLLFIFIFILLFSKWEKQADRHLRTISQKYQPFEITINKWDKKEKHKLIHFVMPSEVLNGQNEILMNNFLRIVTTYNVQNIDEITYRRYRQELNYSFPIYLINGNNLYFYNLIINTPSYSSSIYGTLVFFEFYNSSLSKKNIISQRKFLNFYLRINNLVSKKSKFLHSGKKIWFFKIVFTHCIDSYDLKNENERNLVCKQIYKLAKLFFKSSTFFIFSSYNAIIGYQVNNHSNKKIANKLNKFKNICLQNPQLAMYINIVAIEIKGQTFYFDNFFKWIDILLEQNQKMTTYGQILEYKPTSLTKDNLFQSYENLNLDINKEFDNYFTIHKNLKKWISTQTINKVGQQNQIYVYIPTISMFLKRFLSNPLIYKKDLVKEEFFSRFHQLIYKQYKDLIAKGFENAKLILIFSFIDIKNFGKYIHQIYKNKNYLLKSVFIKHLSYYYKSNNIDGENRNNIYKFLEIPIYFKNFYFGLWIDKSAHLQDYFIDSPKRIYSIIFTRSICRYLATLPEFQAKWKLYLEKNKKIIFKIINEKQADINMIGKMYGFSGILDII